MTTFNIKQNDTRPALLATLKAADGTPVNLTGADVRFHMRGTAGVEVDAPADILDPEAGIVRYIWQAGDTDKAGVFDAEMEVTYSDGGVESFPNNSNWRITVTAELA